MYFDQILRNLKHILPMNMYTLYYRKRIEYFYSKSIGIRYVKQI